MQPQSAYKRPIGADGEAFLRRQGWRTDDHVVRAVASAVDDWGKIDPQWFQRAVLNLRMSRLSKDGIWGIYQASGRLMACELEGMG